MTVSANRLVQAGTHELVDERRLHVDLGYQRPLTAGRVRKMALEFNDILLSTFVVTRRPNGELYVIDGQHRLTAIRRAMPGMAVHCLVLELPSESDEALVFEELNCYRGAPRAVDRFRSMEFRRDPVAVELREAVEKAGYTLLLDHGSSKRAKPCHTNAVGVLQDLYATGGVSAIESTLRTLRVIWPDDPLNGQRYVIEGVSMFLAKYTSDPRFQQKIMFDHWGSRSLGYLRRQASNFNGHAATNLARALLAEYNRGLRSLRLPDLFPLT